MRASRLSMCLYVTVITQTLPISKRFYESIQLFRRERHDIDMSISISNLINNSFSCFHVQWVNCCHSSMTFSSRPLTRWPTSWRGTPSVEHTTSNITQVCTVPRNLSAKSADNGVRTNFAVGVEEARPEGPRVVDGVLVEGTASLSPPTRGLWERCKLPQRGPGRSPGRRRVFLYSEPSDCLSQHLSTCCIQFAWIGMDSMARFFTGIYISISPPHK